MPKKILLKNTPIKILIERFPRYVIVGGDTQVRLSSNLTSPDDKLFISHFNRILKIMEEVFPNKKIFCRISFILLKLFYEMKEQEWKGIGIIRECLKMLYLDAGENPFFRESLFNDIYEMFEILNKSWIESFENELIDKTYMEFMEISKISTGVGIYRSKRLSKIKQMENNAVGYKLWIGVIKKLNE